MICFFRLYIYICVCVFAHIHTYSFLCYQSKFQKQKTARIDGLFGRNYFDSVVCNIQLRALLPFSFRKGAWFFFFFPLLCLFATLFHYFYFKDLNLTLILKLSILLHHKASSSAENESFQELLCITEI